MAEQYEGELNATFTIEVTGIPWHTEQTDEHSDTSLRSVVEQDLANEMKDISDINTFEESTITNVKITEFTVENHYGPDGEEA